MRLWELLETTDCKIHIKDSYHDEVILELFPMQCSNNETSYFSINNRKFAEYSYWDVSKIRIIDNGLVVYVK